MFFWFVSLSVLGTFLVFRDPAIDYRLIALGAVLPDPVDALVVQGRGPLHSVVVAVGILTAVMLATIGRRGLRRRLLAIPIGCFAHLVLDGAWTSTKGFWWPLAGAIGDAPLPSIQRGALAAAVMELIGIAAAAMLWKRFGLQDRELRRRFLATGRLDRSVL